jgi:outer membrane protein OmpA-like peptidoglycan-associated protein
MTVDLVDSVKRMLTPDIVRTAAQRVGEPADTTRRALYGAVPTIFAGLVYAASAPGGTGRVFGMLTERGQTGEGLMRGTFGDRSGAVADALAKSTGTGTESAARLLTLVLPIAASFLGKVIVSNRLTPSAFAQNLFNQKKAVLDDPNSPPGLAGALGVGSLSELGGSAARVDEPHVSAASAPVRLAAGQRAPTVARSAAASRRRSVWGAILPAVVVVAALALWAVFATKHGEARHDGVAMLQPTSPNGTSEAPASPEISAAPTAETAPSARAAPGMTPLILPGGKTLSVGDSSEEAALAHSLRDRTESLPQTFALRGLNFESGTAALTRDSTKTLDDLGAMLASYPDARVRIVGHTDSAGDPRTNQTLSQTRADAIKEALTARGIASDRIETAGSSEKAPGEGNDTREGRAHNRRVDVVLIGR